MSQVLPCTPMVVQDLTASYGDFASKLVKTLYAPALKTAEEDIDNHRLVCGLVCNYMASLPDTRVQRPNIAVGVAAALKADTSDTAVEDRLGKSVDTVLKYMIRQRVVDRSHDGGYMFKYAFLMDMLMLWTIGIKKKSPNFSCTACNHTYTDEEVGEMITPSSDSIDCRHCSGTVHMMGSKGDDPSGADPEADDMSERARRQMGSLYTLLEHLRQTTQVPDGTRPHAPNCVQFNVTLTAEAKGQGKCMDSGEEQEWEDVQ